MSGQFTRMKIGFYIQNDSLLISRLPFFLFFFFLCYRCSRRHWHHCFCWYYRSFRCWWFLSTAGSLEIQYARRNIFSFTLTAIPLAIAFNVVELPQLLSPISICKWKTTTNRFDSKERTKRVKIKRRNYEN